MGAHYPGPRRSVRRGPTGPTTARAAAARHASPNAFLAPPCPPCVATAPAGATVGESPGDGAIPAGPPASTDPPSDRSAETTLSVDPIANPRGGSS